MAHYAFLDKNNIVTEVIVGKDEGDADWEMLYGKIRNQVCKRTSYNTRGGVHPTNNPYRKNYAGIGYRYDHILDAFIPPQPYASWVLDTTTCQWHSPIPRPEDGNIYTWNEVNKSWDQVILSPAIVTS